jgi:uncharacterized membrane protein YdbT with pleckstrin-like domain
MPRMPYPRRLLNEGEDLALDLRPHWWYFANHIFTGVPLFVLFILIFSGLHGDVRGYSLWVWLVLGLAWGVWLGVKYLQWNFTHFVVTSDRVVFRTGVLGKRGVEIPLDRINNINFSQNLWERVIGAGDLAIESAGRDGQSVFSDVRHPDGVQQEIYRQADARDQRRRGPVTAPAPAPAPAPAAASRVDASIPQQLEELAGLRDRGIITPEEFETKKAQLLERM